ncbi:hypothetical protein A3850_008610 [Lewinella sp. 4G2]|nr:hypothetical protein A3850_008610 [Lewinella sp. 4G2]
MIPGAPLIHFGLETLGILLAMRYYYRQRKERSDQVSDSSRVTLLIAAALGALIGSRLLGSLEDPARFWSGGGADGWLYYLQSKTIVGGLLGGLWTVEVAKRWLGIRSRTGDVYVYPLLLAMMIGRLGCLSMGVGEPTYGLPTDSWVGIDLGDGVARHATALYEFLFLGVLWLGLKAVDNKSRLKDGQLFALFLTAYLVWRIGIGFLQPQIPLYGLGAIQWACVLGLLWYIYDHGPGLVGKDR